VFTARDVGRIAKYSAEDGASDVEILAEVAVALGYGWVICTAAKALNDALNVTSALIKIGGALAVSKLLDFLLTVISSGTFKKLAVNKVIALLIVLATATLESLIKAARSMIDKSAQIKQAAGQVRDLCIAVRKLQPDVDDQVIAINELADLTTDVLEAINQTEVDKAFKQFNLP